MKIQHINSKEIIDVTLPVYTKHNGEYGWLVLTHNNDVLFFPSESGGYYYTVTNEYTIL